MEINNITIEFQKNFSLANNILSSLKELKPITVTITGKYNLSKLEIFITNLITIHPKIDIIIEISSFEYQSIENLKDYFIKNNIRYKFRFISKTYTKEGLDFIKNNNSVIVIKDPNELSQFDNLKNLNFNFDPNHPYDKNTISKKVTFENLNKYSKFHLKKYNEFQSNKYLMKKTCNIPFTHIYIEDNLNVYTCIYEKFIGNIKNNLLSEILSSKLVTKIKNKAIQMKCKKCISRFGYFNRTSKKKKILLINPSYQPHWTTAEPYGLLLLAAYLELKDYSVKILDFHANSKINLLKEVKNFSPIFVGIGIATRQSKNGYDIGNLIKENFPDIKISYGGVHATIFPEEPFSKGCADYVCIKESEHTFEKLLKNLNSPQKVNNIFYLENNEIKKTYEECSQPELDTLPFPAYHLINFKKYSDDIHIPYLKNDLALNIMMSRGCPNKCYFCINNKIYNSTQRFYSADYLFNLVKHIKTTYNIDCFHFHEDNIFLNPQILKDFSSLLIENNLNIKWIDLAKVESVVKNKDLLPKLRKAGMLGLEIGIESGDPKVQKYFDKSLSNEMIIKSCNLLKKNDIMPLLLMMSYSHGETINSPRLSLKLLYKIMFNVDEIPTKIHIPLEDETLMGHFTTPCPGTKFYENIDKFGINLLTDISKIKWHNKIHFVPHSLLNDIPINTKSISEKEFTNNIISNKNQIYAFAVRGFYIQSNTIDNNFKTFRDYSIFLYQILKECNSINDVSSIIKIFENSISFQPIETIISSLSILNIFGYTISK